MYNNFKVYFSFSNKENKNHSNRYVLSLNIFKENSYNIIFKNYSGITASDLTAIFLILCLAIQIIQICKFTQRIFNAWMSKVKEKRKKGKKK